jgi:X-X-X-Leu-X-X-Gly heptad repeat protein
MRCRSISRPRRRTTALLGALLAVPTLAAPTAALADEAAPDRDPAGEVRATVEGELQADGELDRAWVRRHARDRAGEPVRESLEEIEADRIPLVVRVRYELDGQEVTADELAGASGEAAIAVELRNPTVESRAVALPGGDDEEVVDLSLPIIADGLLELDDSWRDVRTDVGRLAPGPEGATHLRWSSALFEPLAAPSAQIEIRGDVDQARLPRLEVEAAPVTSATSDLLRLLRDRATDESTADAVAAFLADSLGEGLTGAAEGAEGLASGLDQTTAGAAELGEAIEQMQREIEAAFAELEEGLDQLDAGLGAIVAALEELQAGLREIERGIEQLGDGLVEAHDGATMLRDEIAAPAEAAVRDAWGVLTEQFTVGALDPAYPEALREVGELYGLLTGEIPTADIDPGLGEDAEKLQAVLELVAELTGKDVEELLPEGGDPGDGLDGAAAMLEEYPGLTATLDGLVGGLSEAAGGADGLAAGVAAAADGVGEIRAGIGEMRALLDDADEAPGADGDAEEMEAGIDEFEGALAELADGGDELADGIRQLAQGSDDLVALLEDELAAANLDLGTIDALSERASQRADTEEQDGIGGHDRYVLVFHEEPWSPVPVAALAGLLVLAAVLELVRRRLVA